MLIAYLGPPSPTTPVAKHLIDGFVRPGRNPATLSAVSVTEVLVEPIGSGAAPMIARVVEFLLRFPNVSLREIDFAVAREAAVLRARYRLRTPDALVIASGLRAGVEHLISDDAEWKKLRDLSPEIRVHQLANHLPFP